MLEEIIDYNKPKEIKHSIYDVTGAYYKPINKELTSGELWDYKEFIKKLPLRITQFISYTAFWGYIAYYIAHEYFIPLIPEGFLPF